MSDKEKRQLVIELLNKFMSGMQAIILDLDTEHNDDIIGACEQAGEALTAIEGVDWPNLEEA